VRDDREPVRVLVADDHEVVREGLRRLLESDPGVRIIGEAASGDEALARALEQKPDVLILDISMPGKSGFETLRELEDQSGVRTVIFTAAIDRAGIFNAIQLGARAVVLKTAASDVLMDAVWAVAQGDYWLDRTQIASFPEVLRRLSAPRIQGDPYGLTERQLEIVTAVVEGLNNREIAERLHITDHTVKHHLTKAFNKTGVSTRLELALLATQKGLVNL
jgi:two-component system, NarL family, nitrate/nitrite response regulator NarL